MPEIHRGEIGSRNATTHITAVKTNVEMRTGSGKAANCYGYREKIAIRNYIQNIEKVNITSPNSDFSHFLSVIVCDYINAQPNHFDGVLESIYNIPRDVNAAK